MKGSNACRRFCLRGAALSLAFAALAFARDPQMLLVKRVTGDVRALRAASAGGEAREVKAGDLPDSGATFVTAPGAALELRFHPDFMTLHAAGGSRLRVDYSPGDSAGGRAVSLDAGRVTGDLSRQGPGLRLEDARTEARMREGRIAFATDARSSTVLVLEGEARLVHRPTGAARTLTRGQKAVSGPEGIVVTRAEARELAEAGLDQNRLEVDFWDPATEDYRTLEIEYERRP
jgi:hypothetical protein